MSSRTAGWERALAKRLARGRLRRAEALAPYTTFRIGGPADLYFRATTAEELAAAVTAARELAIPHFLLGLGANVLVGDRGFRGLVIHNQARRVTVDEEGGRLTAESGAVVWPDLVEIAIERRLSGLEHYAGIPSSVGGALWQNLHFLSPAPARERTLFIAEVTEGAELLTEAGERCSVGVEYFRFGYDESILHHRADVVLTATFRLAAADPEAMRRVVTENLSWRAQRHPPLEREPSAGSIFKKIEGIGAGRLIEECGLKGLTFGGAMLTHRHANIVINRGGATAADVRRLIDFVQAVVEQRSGHRLEVEISFVGEF